jgi:hypothetical protein
MENQIYESRKGEVKGIKWNYIKSLELHISNER